MTTLITLVGLLFVFLSIFLFYKKGIQYIEKYEKFPKFKDTQYFLIAGGIFSPMLLYFLPVIGVFFQCIFFVLFFVAYHKILNIHDSKAMKPETLLLLGAGLGFFGSIGFVIGLTRGMSDLKEKQAKSVLESPKDEKSNFA